MLPQVPIVSRRERRTRPNAQTDRAKTPVKIAVDAAPGASNQPFIETPSRTEPTSAPTIATRCAQRGPCTVTE